MRVIFAGGGTGGHLYPAIAVAKKIRQRDPDAKILFVGTSEGIEARVLPEEGFELKTLRVMGLKGKKKTEKLKSLLALPGALMDSLTILRSFQPDAVLGVGGFVSGPVVLAAFLSGRKTMLQEQNSIPGLTNRLLGRLAGRIYTCYAESHAYFPRKKVLQTGNPIREGLDSMDREEALKHFGLHPGKKTILIIGGSRGAHTVNQMVSEMVGKITWGDLSLQFLHQSGEADLNDVFKAYEAAGMEAVVKPFIKEMGYAYAAADLAVSRAGAVALSELCAAGIPQLLIPFPYAADGHQKRNAAVVSRAGAAEMLIQEELTAEKLGERILDLLSEPEKLAEMKAAALSHARPRAAEVLVDDMERIVKEGAKI